jgi:hypothetical protein
MCAEMVHMGENAPVTTSKYLPLPQHGVLPLCRWYSVAERSLRERDSDLQCWVGEEWGDCTGGGITVQIMTVVMRNRSCASKWERHCGLGELRGGGGRRGEVVLMPSDVGLWRGEAIRNTGIAVLGGETEGAVTCPPLRRPP